MEYALWQDASEISYGAIDQAHCAQLRLTAFKKMRRNYRRKPVATMPGWAAIVLFCVAIFFMCIPYL
ncbi:hypothetical protein [Undibacterium sp.]|uniref:hypothetical protein n=1 Tax=Undibacterium sp. TaxID=1914977 RepID=UPI0025DE965B|nr:hypothetical protein [Undibacterium sp.]